MRHQQSKGHVGKHQAESAAGNAQRQTLHQQFAGNPSPTGAKRRADSKLMPPGLRTHEHEVRHVYTNEQQHQAECSHENFQDGAHVPHDIPL